MRLRFNTKMHLFLSDQYPKNDLVNLFSMVIIHWEGVHFILRIFLALIIKTDNRPLKSFPMHCFERFLSQPFMIASFDFT